MRLLLSSLTSLFGLVVCLEAKETPIQTDLHTHLTPAFTIHDALKLAEVQQVKLGIVEHPGPRYTHINEDASLLQYIENLRQYPVYVGLQPVEPGWRKRFSKEVLERLDYVIMDALELPNEDGSFFRIWEKDTRIDEVDAFMDRYIRFYLQILETEDLDILASPTYLPDTLKDQYDKIWTEARMKTLIQAAVDQDVAIEINCMYQIPSQRFVKLAKSMGARFSLGTNGRTAEIVGHLDYGHLIVESCELTEADFFHVED